jgi:hypothetical protein
MPNIHDIEATFLVNWIIVFALLATIGSIVGRRVLPIMRKLEHMLDDFNGTEARPGVPARPGIMERVESIEQRIKKLETDAERRWQENKEKNDR